MLIAIGIVAGLILGAAAAVFEGLAGGAYHGFSLRWHCGRGRS